MEISHAPEGGGSVTFRGMDSVLAADTVLAAAPIARLVFSGGDR
jgi:hypothetical protein